MHYEQKEYTIAFAMTSDPNSDAATRARLVALLTDSPPFSNRGKYRGRYVADPADERAWHRAGEQERRRMLKDCGWL